jgi:hypothetical protein
MLGTKKLLMVDLLNSSISPVCVGQVDALAAVGGAHESFLHTGHNEHPQLQPAHLAALYDQESMPGSQSLQGELVAQSTSPAVACRGIDHGTMQQWHSLIKRF